MKEKIFIRNVKDVDVDGLRGINHYTIKAVYDQIEDDGYATVVFEPIAKFDLTWNEIEQDGGIAQVNRNIGKRYNVEEW